MIETDVHESVGKCGGLHRSRSETRCAPGKKVAHGDKGAYGEETGPHPRLNGERDLWRERGGRVSLELELSVGRTSYEQIDHRIRAEWWKSVNTEVGYEGGLPSKLSSGLVQQNTKHDGDQNVSCDCGGVSRGGGIDPL